jgi:hypothetical protein
MPWYMNPISLRDTARDVCRIASGGRPQSLRLTGIGRPQGWLVPTSTVGVAVVSGDGTRVSFEPELPVPLPLAYGYRVARLLGSR